MEFGWDEFDRHFVDLDPDLLACVAEWFVERFEVDFHPIENPLAEIIDDSGPYILADLNTQRPDVLFQAAYERSNIFPEGLKWYLDNNDVVHPFYQISVPAIDHLSGLERNWHASLGSIIVPMGQPFAIRIDTIREASASCTARYRTSVEIIDKYDGENRVEVAFYELNEDQFQKGIATEGSDDRLEQLCMHFARKIEDFGLLYACQHINSRRNGVLESVLRRIGKK